MGENDRDQNGNQKISDYDKYLADIMTEMVLQLLKIRRRLDAIERKLAIKSN